MMSYDMLYYHMMSCDMLVTCHVLCYYDATSPHTPHNYNPTHTHTFFEHSWLPCVAQDLLVESELLVQHKRSELPSGGRERIEMSEEMDKQRSEVYISVNISD